MEHRESLIARARAAEDDRYFNNLRVIPMGGKLVIFAPGEMPVVEDDIFGAGPAMERAAEAVASDPGRDAAIDRICARHRAWCDVIAGLDAG